MFPTRPAWCRFRPRPGDRGFELVSTGGTAKALADAGLPVVNVSRRHRLPRNDGRPRQDAAPEDPRRHPGAPPSPRGPRRWPRQHGIGLVDLVVVNLYPFVETAAKPGIAFDDLIEQIDIGGPSLVRAAAKNFRDVLVVVSPDDYAAVIAELDRDGGPSLAFRFDLARRAFAHTGSLRHRDRGDARRGHRRRRRVLARASPQAPLAPKRLVVRRRASCATCATARTRISRPRGTRSSRAPGLGAPAVLQGKELSFTNLLDLDAAARIVLEFDEPAAAVIKHTNPCGVATGAIDRRGLRARARGRCAGGVRRHRRPQPADRRGDGAGDRLDVHRSRRGARRGRRGARRCSRPRPTCAWSSPTSRICRRRVAGTRRELRSILGALLVQERDAVIEARAPWPTDGAARS